MRRFPARIAPLLALCFLWPATAAAPTAPQIFDLNRVAGGPIGSAPTAGTAFNGLVFFTALDLAHGREPWVSDGTVAGTHLLLDVWPGPEASSTAVLGVFGTKLLFIANDGVRGTELWVTDGTTAGTQLVKDVSPGGTSGLGAAGLAVTGAQAYFLGTTAAEGQELWVTDGTTAGTHRVSDVGPATATGAFAPLVALGNTVFFVGDDGLTGRELWKSDGTAAGTLQVADLRAGTASGVLPGALLVAAPGFVVFAGSDGTNGVEAYATTGTSATLLIDANPMAASGSPQLPVALGTKLLFVANDGTASTLYSTDGTAAGTVALTAMGNLSAPVVLGGKALFSGTDATHGVEPWTTDGTVAGTAFLAEVNPAAAASNPGNFVVAGARAYFTATDAAGASLWTTDGTGAGTVVLAAATSPANLRAVGLGLFFSATDATHGVELWHSDGTALGTAFLADANLGVPNGFVLQIGAAGTKQLFSATEPTHGTELWASDGTPAGTVLLSDLEAGSTNSSSNPDAPVIVGPLAFFTANDGVNGLQLWVTDGTQAGTLSPSVGKVTAVLVPPAPFAGSPTPRPPTLQAYSGGVAFMATDATNGIQLWVSDGTAAGTIAVSTGRSLTLDSASLLAVVSDVIYFAASDTRGRELWSTIGTAASTALVLDVLAGAASSNPRVGAALGDSLVFVADATVPPSTVVRQALVLSDGSGPGTVVIGALPAATTLFAPPVLSGSRLFYPSRAGTNYGLYATDGTAVLTSSQPMHDVTHELVAFAGGVVFVGGFDPRSGRELDRPIFWSGATPQAVILATGNTTRPVDRVHNITVAGPLVYFLARDQAGDGLFVSDGTFGPGTHRFATGRTASALIGAVNGALLFNDGSRLNIVTSPGHFLLLANSASANLPNNLALDLPSFFGHSFFPASGQLWETDGTPTGTFQVTRTTPSPTNLTIFGDQLLLSANDPNRGRELFGVPLDPTPPVITPLLAGTTSDAGFFTSDVSVTWDVVENESPLTSQVGCGPVIVTADTAGSVFTCTATSLGGMSAQQVTVRRDATKPVVLCPPSVTVEATNAQGAAVAFPLPLAQDAIDPAPQVTTDPASGTTFALGTTMVAATAVDAAGNRQSCSFPVRVADTKAPQLTCPAAMNVPATGPDGAVVTFTLAATDAVDAAPTVTSMPASGATLPLGPTLVTVSAADAQGNAASCQFLVTVRDPAAPVVTCPADQTATATEAWGVAVTYPAATVTDVADPMPLVITNHASGDTFSIGTTTVEVTALNHSGHSASCSFTVKVDGNLSDSKKCGCDAGGGAAALVALALLMRRRRS